MVKKKKSEVKEIAKQFGKTTAGVAVTAAKGLVEVGKELGTLTVKGAKKLGEKISDTMDITCDNCNRLMKPGFLAVKRKLGERQYQFCSEGCANKFVKKACTE